MHKKTVYIETSVVSYLIARPSSDLLAAAWQKATVDWWDTQRSRFDLYTSDVVIEEAGRGDLEATERRLQALAGIPVACAHRCGTHFVQSPYPRRSGSGQGR